MNKYIFYFIILFVFSACINQIELETDNADPVFVVDGIFSDIQEQQTIKLSTSIDLNSQVNIPV